MSLARLAALHGVATSYSPSADVTVPVSDTTVVAVLAALDVDASTPEAIGEALGRHEADLAAGCCRRPWWPGPGSGPPW